MSGHLMRHDADHARRRARILKRDATRAPPGRPRTPRISGISRRAGTRGECTLPSTRRMNLTAVTTARHSQGVWVEPSSLRGLHHPIRVAGWQKRLRRSRENSPILGWTWLPSGDILIWHSAPNAHKWLASRKTPSEDACQVSFNLHSWVILPTKGSLQQDVFLVKNFIVNAIGEQVRTPAEICSGMHYRLALPLPWAAR